MSNTDLVDIPFEVRLTEHGTRVDVFLSRRITRMSRNKAALIVKSGTVRRDGGEAITKPSTKVLAGDTIILKRRKLIEAPTDDVALPVVHEDEHMLAVNKPGDLVVHPTASAYHRTLIRILRDRRPDQKIDLAHRLDKETSGLILLGKSVPASTALKEQFASRTVEKAYYAIVVGVPERDEWVVDAPLRLVPDSVTNVLMEVGGAGAAVAMTEVTVLSRGLQASLVEARPKTGRQHQIRVHLMHAGFPIIGDKLYLGDEETFIAVIRDELDRDTVSGIVGHWRQALHAQRATFDHPVTGERVTLQAPLPGDMVALARRFSIPLPQ